jgi:hypothetical protein
VRAGAKGVEKKAMAGGLPVGQTDDASNIAPFGVIEPPSYPSTKASEDPSRKHGYQEGRDWRIVRSRETRRAHAQIEHQPVVSPQDGGRLIFYGIGCGSPSRQFRVAVARVSRRVAAKTQSSTTSPPCTSLHWSTAQKAWLLCASPASPFIDSASPCPSPQPLSCTPGRMFLVSCPLTGWEKLALRLAADGRIGAMQEVYPPATQVAGRGPPRRARTRRPAIPCH